MMQSVFHGTVGHGKWKHVIPIQNVDIPLRLRVRHGTQHGRMSFIVH